MLDTKRKIDLYTPNKIYSGYLDIKTDSIRTIDLLNSSSLYWKDPAEKSFNDAILLTQATVTIEGKKVLGTFPKLQLRLSDIVFFSDVLEKSGNFTEKVRATALSTKSQEKVSMVRVITRMRGDAFFLITGIFFGLFKSKSQHQYLPVTRVQINEILRNGDQWINKKVPIDNSFIGLATRHIEACTFGNPEDMPNQ